MSEKEFTFDNKTTNAHSANSGINKFLISQDLDSKGERIEAATLIRKFADHSPLILSKWGQPDIPDKLSHYFDSSLLEDEKGKVEMLQAWEGKLPKPSSDLEWAPWLEATTRRILACNARLAKERRRLRGAQVKTHSKKIQLAESSSNGTQLTNKCGTSCPNRKESWQRSSKLQLNVTVTFQWPNGLGMGTLVPKLSLNSTESERK
jgi:hypothetical protein